VNASPARALVALLLALPAAPAAAQAYARQGYVEPSPREIELSLQGGLVWSAAVSGSSGRLVFDPGPEAAAALGFQLDGRSQVEIRWLAAWPRARFESSSLVWASSPAFPVLAQYLQVGGTTNFDQGPVEPYIAGGLGLAWFHPSSVPTSSGTTIQPADTWLFAFNLGGGARFWLSESFGIRVEARFLFPVLFNSGAFLSGPQGAAFQVNAGIPVVQGDLTIGVAFSL
jgi:opacity protein-like surface antigen